MCFYIYIYIEVFIENGYESKQFRRIVSEIKSKRNNTELAETVIDESTENISQTVTLPWIPGLSPKLRKCYKKAGYKVVFKSGANLKRLLTSRNKSRLPANSHPGVYKINCPCTTQPYVGETKLRISTRADQHKDYVSKQKHGQSAIASHALSCGQVPDWENTETLKVEPKRFERKVREALEIQRLRCGPKNGGLNLDDGQYVTSQFWTPMLQFLRDQVRSI